MNKSDRRRMERLDLKLPTKLFWVGDNKEHKSIELMTSNISAGGAYFITNRALPKSTKVKLDMILDLDRLHELGGRQSHINVSGSVIRTDQHGMAISFDRGYKILPYKTTHI